MKLLYGYAIIGFFYIGIFASEGAPNALCTGTKQIDGRKITLLLIVDQLAMPTIQRTYPFLRGGIKMLIDKGIVYRQARHPHGMPETCPGHASISTGTLPSIHGIIANAWYDADAKKMNTCDIVEDPHAAVLSGPDGSVKNEFLGIHNLLVDTLADQIMLHNGSSKEFKVVTFSPKSRAAIMLAGSLGTPYWLDLETGNFTSGKQYMSTWPQWLTDFNEKAGINTMTSYTWRLSRAPQDPAYRLPRSDQYTSVTPKTAFVEHTIPLSIGTKNAFLNFTMSPLCDAAMLELAKKYVHHWYANNESKHLCLMVSLSSLDRIGHAFGPESLEALDTLYQIDDMLNNFIENIITTVGEEQTTIMLTADHGITPIPEHMQEIGLQTAGRAVITKETIAQWNKELEERFGIFPCIDHHELPYLYLSKELKSRDGTLEYIEILAYIKRLITSYPEIESAWTAKELRESNWHADDPRMYLKNQWMAKRSGDIIYLIRPYSYAGQYTSGTTHATPYNIDVHIPIVFYQPGKTIHTDIYRRVYSQQIAPTLAAVLGVSQPSASFFEPLSECLTGVPRFGVAAVEDRRLPEGERPVAVTHSHG